MEQEKILMEEKQLQRWYIMKRVEVGEITFYQWKTWFHNSAPTLIKEPMVTLAEAWLDISPCTVSRGPAKTSPGSVL